MKGEEREENVGDGEVNIERMVSCRDGIRGREGGGVAGLDG